MNIYYQVIYTCILLQWLPSFEITITIIDVYPYLLFAIAKKNDKLFGFSKYRFIKPFMLDYSHI